MLKIKLYLLRSKKELNVIKTNRVNKNENHQSLIISKVITKNKSEQSK